MSYSPAPAGVAASVTRHAAIIPKIKNFEVFMVFSLPHQQVFENFDNAVPNRMCSSATLFPLWSRHGARHITLNIVS